MTSVMSARRLTIWRLVASLESSPTTHDVVARRQCMRGAGGDSACVHGDRTASVSGVGLVGATLTNNQSVSNTTFQIPIPIPLENNQKNAKYRSDTGKCPSLLLRFMTIQGNCLP